MSWTQQDLDNYHAAMARMRTPPKAHKRPPLNEKIKQFFTPTKENGFRYIVFGQVPSKSNSYRISGNRLFKTKQVTDYEKSFLLQCKEKGRNIQGEFELYMDVYYTSKRPDLDGCTKVFLDCLQKAKVIRNDNRCVLLYLRKFVDKTNPRIEYQIIEK